MTSTVPGMESPAARAGRMCASPKAIAWTALPAVRPKASVARGCNTPRKASSSDHTVPTGMCRPSQTAGCRSMSRARIEARTGCSAGEAPTAAATADATIPPSRNPAPSWGGLRPSGMPAAPARAVLVPAPMRGRQRWGNRSSTAGQATSTTASTSTRAPDVTCRGRRATRCRRVPSGCVRCPAGSSPLAGRWPPSR
ncbi:Uncharacterised protein [Mycobacteroides abscessus subsp. abscessus]|nr:Uncharacterised protein [Mycobacteroides abscessus subsp. abscessus]